MKYSLGILKNKNLFMRHKYPFPKTFLDTQLQPSGFSGITKLSKPWLQKDGMSKKRLDVALISN